MGWSTFLFLTVLVVIAIFCYILLALNNSIVVVDLLFHEIQVSLGVILLTFFLLGLFVAILCEFLYFFRRKNRNE